MELSSSNVKKAFYILLEKETPNFFYLSGNGTFLYLRKSKP